MSLQHFWMMHHSDIIIFLKGTAPCDSFCTFISDSVYCSICMFGISLNRFVFFFWTVWINCWLCITPDVVFSNSWILECIIRGWMTVIGFLTHDVFCMLCSVSHVKIYMIKVSLFSLSKMSTAQVCLLLWFVLFYSDSYRSPRSLARKKTMPCTVM